VAAATGIVAAVLLLLRLLIVLVPVLLLDQVLLLQVLLLVLPVVRCFVDRTIDHGKQIQALDQRRAIVWVLILEEDLVVEVLWMPTLRMIYSKRHGSIGEVVLATITVLVPVQELLVVAVAVVVVEIVVLVVVVENPLLRFIVDPMPPVVEATRMNHPLPWPPKTAFDHLLP
jgi:hypothetical protein